MRLLLLAASLFCLSISAQTPQYFMAAGSGFNQANLPKITGFVSFGVKVAGTDSAHPTYSYSTIESTNATSSIRTGVLQILIQQDGFTIGALGDAGMATGTTALGGAFSFGGVIAYDLSKRLKIPGTNLMFSIRPTKQNLTVVAGAGPPFQVAYQFGIGKTF